MNDKSCQRNIRFIILIGAMCSVLSVHAENKLTDLANELNKTQSQVKQTIAGEEDPEAGLEAQYNQLQSVCTETVNQLDHDYKRYTADEAKTNAIGGFITLLGSVTVYTPGKIVLMGLGISSSGSGTISSGLTQVFATQSTLDATTLASLRVQLNQIFDKFDAIDPVSDPSGARRFAILARGKNTCLGLSPAVAPTSP